MKDANKDIRGLTRLSLPESDDYLFRLGVATYGFASLSSFMAEVITYLDPSSNRHELMDKTSGPLHQAFKDSVSLWTGVNISEIAALVSIEFEKLIGARNDIVHAYPITSASGDQILHRRRDRESKYFEVNSDFIDDFIASLDSTSAALYEIRAKAGAIF